MKYERGELNRVAYRAAVRISRLVGRMEPRTIEEMIKVIEDEVIRQFDRPTDLIEAVVKSKENADGKA